MLHHITKYERFPLSGILVLEFTIFADRTLPCHPKLFTRALMPDSP